MAEKHLGCPDWGPDGEERCYECDAPVDDTLLSCTKYEGRIAEIFAKCFVCGSPRLDSLGECPRCRGLVFEFSKKVACLNETNGRCDFSLNKEYLEDQGIDFVRQTIENLLVSPSKVTSHHEGGRKTFHVEEIAFDESRGWHIQVTEVESLEKQREKARKK